jgi:O2-independent ubiquinone biosynthesis protein UbiV
MKLALGPILYYWTREAVLDFYRAAAGWPVDIVYLGETVCSKRRALRFTDWLDIADALREAGKEVVLSTLTLVEAASELSMMRRIAANRRYPVEANDMAAVHMLSGAAQGFVAGPHINIYNGETLAVLNDCGAHRWVLPPELSREDLAALQAARPAAMETEVFAFGRLPLAFSARCFTARAHDLPKDACEFRCREHPDGMPMRTREAEEFLVLNGIHVQSALTLNLIGELPALAAAGVDVLRLSPQSRHMSDIAAAFRAALDGAATAQIPASLLPTGPCNGYWHGTPGMTWR